MSSIFETGHAKNIANFQDLISFCQGYGTAYNPSKAALQLGGLQNLLQTAQTNLNSVTISATAYDNAVNARASAFDTLQKLGTRMVNALKATDAGAKTIADATGFNKKLNGASARKPAVKPAQDSQSATVSSKTVSTSQQSYDQKIEHFAKLINVLATEPSYNPNEVVLQTATLNAQLTTLKNLNTAVTNAYTTLSNARIARDQTLYAVKTGLCDVALDVKNYIVSVFGKSSPEYKQVSGIRFNKIRK